MITYVNKYSRPLSSTKRGAIPLRDNASLLHLRIGLGHGSISFPIETCL